MDVISDRDATTEPLDRDLRASRQSYEQRPGWVIPGLPTMAGALAATALGIVLTIVAGSSHNGALGGFGVVGVVGASLSFGGLFVVQPNESRVLILFGRYIGSVTEAG